MEGLATTEHLGYPRAVHHLGQSELVAPNPDPEFAPELLQPPKLHQRDLEVLLTHRQAGGEFD